MSLNDLKEEEIDRIIKIFKDLARYKNIEKESYDDMVKQKKIYLPFISDETCSKIFFQSSTTRTVKYLIGRKGSGKTTILKNLRIECFESFFIKKDLEHLEQEKMVLPVYIELRNLFQAVLDKIALRGEIIEDIKDLIKNLNIQLLRQIEKSYDDLRELGVINDNIFLRIHDFINKQINNLINSNFPILCEDDDNLISHYQTLKNHIEDISNNKDSEIFIKQLEVNDNLSDFFKNWFKIDLFKELFDDLRQIKDYPLNFIYFLLDDFSEISQINQRIIIESFVEPLFNNVNNSYFCIACYPELYYTGSFNIDQEYQLINIDFFQMDSVNSYEEKVNQGIESSINLILKRLKFEFPDLFRDVKSLDLLFDDVSEFFRHLFFISMRNPRLIGLILSYNKCIMSIKMKIPLSINRISEASEFIFNEYLYKDYFSSLLSETMIDSYFSKNQLIIDKIVLDQLLNQIKNSFINNSSGFFLVNKNINSLFSIFSRLEFMGLIFKIQDISENETLYCLNYGSCLRHGIYFGLDKDITYWIENSEQINISARIEGILQEIDQLKNLIFKSNEVPQRFSKDYLVFEEIFKLLKDQQVKILHTLYLQKDYNKGWMTPEEIGITKRILAYYIPHMRIMRILRSIRNTSKAKFLIDETEKGKILFRLSNFGILFEEYLTWKLFS